MSKQKSDISSQSSDNNLINKSESRKLKTEGSVTMEELLASLPTKSISIHRGQEVAGNIVLIGKNELVVDFGGKSEGVIQKKDFNASQLSSLNIGDSIKAYVIEPENDSGQVVLSLFNQAPKIPVSRGGKTHMGGRSSSMWNRFIQVMHQNSLLKGRVMEINKGGLIVEVDGIRGFLPSSQIGLQTLINFEGVSTEMSDLIGQELGVYVIEVDQSNNRLIFSQRGQVDEQTKNRLTKYKEGQKIAGKLAAILPFGLLVELEDKTEGVVFSAEVSWERIENLNDAYKTGQQVEANVINVDESYGRLNLSIKQLAEDPFTKAAENYQTEDTVKGTVISTSEQGVSVKLENGVEGFLPFAKVEPGVGYTAGQEVKMQVDNVDKNKRRINLTPIITTTAGLIYK